MLAAAVLFALPFVKGPYVQELGQNAVTVRVEVEPPQPVTVELAGAADAGTRRIDSREARAFHSMRITGLDPGRKYVYTVRAGTTPQVGTFTTAPANTDKASFSFLLYGDNRTDPAAHQSVVRAMAQSPSDFLVHTGDFVEDGREGGHWQAFFDIESPMLRDRCVFACVGNHELLEEAGDTFLRYFGPTFAQGEAPKLFGSFRWGNTRFFLLNGQNTFDSGTEIEWLRRELASADNEAGLGFRIAVVHFGYRSAGPHGDNPRLLSAGVDKLLKEKKVDLVLSGHDHLYERGEEKGMRYVVSGGGGAPLYRVKQRLPSTRKLEATYHYVAFEVADSVVRLVAKRADGSILDTCSFGKSPGWDCDKSASVDKSVELGAPVPGTKAEAPPVRSACGCGTADLAGSRAASLTSAGLIALLALRRRFRYSRS